MIKVDQEVNNAGVRIKVIGVGGAGGNAVGRMVQQELSGVDLVAVNTDIQALSVNPAPVKLQIGNRVTGGRGTGADPESGKLAAIENQAQIYDLLKGMDLVVLTLGLGGGTGTGAGPVVARLAHKAGAIVIGFVTLPFEYQGEWRMEIARQGLSELKKHLDTIIVIPNEKIYQVITGDIPLFEAYGKIDEILSQGVAAISDLVTRPGLENLDFADLRSIIEEGGEGLMGTGIAAGETRAEEAARMAISNPFLKKEELFTAANVLISIAGSNPGVREVGRVVAAITKELAATVKRFDGTVIDSRLEDNLKVTVIATGLEQKSVSVTPTGPAPKTRKLPEPERPQKSEGTLWPTTDEEDDPPAYLNKHNNPE